MLSISRSFSEKFVKMCAASGWSFVLQGDSPPQLLGLFQVDATGTSITQIKPFCDAPLETPVWLYRFV